MSTFATLPVASTEEVVDSMERQIFDLSNEAVRLDIWNTYVKNGQSNLPRDVANL